jgi:hypothetical protein
MESSSSFSSNLNKSYLSYAEVTKISLPVKQQLNNNCSLEFVKKNEHQHCKIVFQEHKNMSNINKKNIIKVIHQEKPKSKYWPFSKWSRFTYPQECYYCGTDNVNEHSRLGHSTILKTGRCIFCQTVLTMTVVK